MKKNFQKIQYLKAKEQLEAANILGVKDVIFLRHSDQSLEDTPEFRKEIVKFIRLYKPEIVVTAEETYSLFRRLEREKASLTTIFQPDESLRPV